MRNNIASELFSSALRITKATKIQREVFDSWKRVSDDQVFGALAFDTETTGLDRNIPKPMRFGNTDIHLRSAHVFGISLAIPFQDRIALFWGRIGTKLYDRCAEFLSTANGYKVAHNLKFDLDMLQRAGVEVCGEVDCTLLMARLVWNRRMKFGLKDLGPLLVPDAEGWEDELKAHLRNIKSAHTRAGYPKDYANYSFADDKIIGKYAMDDTFVTLMLNVELRPFILKSLSEVYKREKAFLSVAHEQEVRGMKFSIHTGKTEIRKIQKRLPKLLKDMYKIAGTEFNPGSPMQLLQVFKTLKIRDKELTLKGKITTCKEQLELLQISTDKKIVKKLIETLFNFRSMTKMLNTYLIPLTRRALENNSIIHCTINPFDSRTGRETITNPALQTLPRTDTGYNKHNPVRKCFVPRFGYYLYFIDYSQMEMWLFAIIANEVRMLRALQDGLDIHQFVADDIYGKGASKEQRQKTKAVNFGIIYGMGSPALAIKIKSGKTEAFTLRNNYLARYPRIQGLMEDCKQQLINKGFVQDLFGRKYNLSVRDAYKATNCLVQGGCAQILKLVHLRLKKLFDSFRLNKQGKKPHVLLSIHDEIVFEVPIEWPNQPSLVRKIQDRMERIPQLLKKGITLKTSVTVSDKSWEDKHSVQKEVI